MLGRCYIAQKVRAAHGCQRAADSGGNMVIPRRNICNERPQHIKRRTVAHAFLQLHVGGNLIVRHVPRPFHHYLYAFCPCALRQFAKVQKLLQLRAVACIGQAAGAQTVAQTNGNIILGADVQNFVIVFVQRVFFAVVQHPAGNKAAAAAYNVHHAPFAGQHVKHVFVNAAVYRHKVRAVCRLLADNFKQIFFRHFHNGTAFFNGFHRCLINWHRAHHNRACADNGPARSVDIVAGR